MRGPEIDFSTRRSRLCKELLDGSVAIISSASSQYRNADAEFPFRQDSNFYYLSGFDEPESIIVLRPFAKDKKFIIFCRDRDPLKEQWDGFRSGQEGAIEDFGADEAYSISLADELIPSLIEGASNVYYSMSSPNGINLKIEGWLNQIRTNSRQGSEVPENLLSLDLIIDELRLLKTQDELSLMRKAGEITCEAHIKAMEKVSPGMFEYQLEAEYLYTFINGGARFPAYNSIVGGGNNACILHYKENNSQLNQGDLVLVDAGCEYDHYASDVTRTFPVGKKFSDEQKTIYEIVLEAHKQVCNEIKPGNSWDIIHNKSIQVITEGLIDIGILKGNSSDLIKTGEYSKYYMHRVGHWLGMDVHDVGNYKKSGKWRELEPNMVLTVEPGIYILDSLEGIEEKWLGIGIRVEDDLLVTEKGCEILSSKAPREIKEIENLKS